MPIGNAPLSPYTGTPGWLTRGEEEALMHYASLVPANGIAVEIGVEFARSTAAIASALKKNTTHYAVDLFPDNPTYGDMAAVHVGNLAEAGYVDRIKYLKGDSKVIGQEFSKPINLLFVDGSHVYEDVKGDIKAWIPHVEKGGYVIFHDSVPPTNTTPHPLHHEVQRAIDEWHIKVKTKWEELSPVDTMRVFKRVK